MSRSDILAMPRALALSTCLSRACWISGSVRSTNGPAVASARLIRAHAPSCVSGRQPEAPTRRGGVRAAAARESAASSQTTRLRSDANALALCAEHVSWLLSYRREACSAALPWSRHRQGGVLSCPKRRGAAHAVANSAPTNRKVERRALIFTSSAAAVKKC
jgi:hypothetical protein